MTAKRNPRIIFPEGFTRAEAGIALAIDQFPRTLGSPADDFNRLRVWVAARDVNVRSQLT